MAGKFGVAVRQNQNWINDSFCQIDHPLVNKITTLAQIREQTANPHGSSSEIYLLYLATCLEMAKYRNLEWANDLLKRIASIPLRDKNSPSQYYSCVAELEHLILLMGHGYQVNPLMPSSSQNVKTPESEIVIGDKILGCEVCSVADFDDSRKRITQKISERVIVKLEGKVFCKAFKIDIPDDFLEKVYERSKDVIAGILNASKKVSVENQFIEIQEDPFPHDMDHVLKSKNEYTGFSVAIPGRELFGQPVVFLNKGLIVKVKSLITKKEMEGKVLETLERIIKSKISKKQIDPNKYYGGLLMVKIPYNYEIKNDQDLERMKKDFLFYGEMALECVRFSSRYKGVLIFSAATQVGDSKGIITLRGQLFEKESLGFGRNYFQAPVHIGDLPPTKS